MNLIAGVKKLLACSALVIASGTVFSADTTNAVVTTVKGEVLVLQGQRYLPVEAGKRVADGDRLMIMEESLVKLVYDTGCEITWTGARIADVDVENCPTAAAIWIPCLAAAAKQAEDAIVLMKATAPVTLVRGNEKLTAVEGQALEKGDVLHSSGAVDINYNGNCTKNYPGQQAVNVDPVVCPVGEVSNIDGDVMLTHESAVNKAVLGRQLFEGDSLDVEQKANVGIRYYNGCDESWDGKKIVGISAENCPIAAPLDNCSVAMFGNMTPADLITVGGGITIGIITIPRNPPLPPPVSP